MFETIYGEVHVGPLELLLRLVKCTGQLYAPGVRHHIENALNLGATREEILEAIQITSWSASILQRRGPILKAALEKPQAAHGGDEERGAATRLQRRPRRPSRKCSRGRGGRA